MITTYGCFKRESIQLPSMLANFAFSYFYDVEVLLYNINSFCIAPGVDATNLLEGKLKFPGGEAKAKIAGMGAGASMFVPMTSIFIGLPSRCTLLYFLRAATADDLAENTTSAVPWKNGDES